MLYRSVLHVLAPLNVLRLLLTIAWGLLLVLLTFRFLSQPARNRCIRLWSRTLLRVVGVRLVVCGDVPQGRLAQTGFSPGGRGLMLLANHVSWLDVHAINATVPSRLVAKSEISRWPVLGTLASASGTLFVERGRRHAVHGVNQKIARHLQQGETVGVYPEGTTSDGGQLLPFHSNLVQPALDAQAQVRPVALRYTQYGAHSRAAAFIDNDALVTSLWRVLTAPRLVVELHWLAAVPTHLQKRQEVAQWARASIASALAITLAAVPERTVSPRTTPESPGAAASSAQ